MATRTHSVPPPPERLFQELAATLEFDRFFLNAARGAALAVGADYAGLIRRHGAHLRYQFFAALAAHDHRHLIPLTIGSGPAAFDLTGLAGETLYCADSRHGPAAAPELAVLGVRAHLVVPVRVAGRTEGALVLAWQTPPARAPGARKRRLAEAFAAFMGQACYRSALEAALIRDARHDTLTGLPNRGVLMDRLTYARRRAMRNDRLLVVALLDIDNFKHINDERGHEAGDHLLTTVADRLSGCVRLADTVSRYGGDEFVILMEDVTHLEQAETMLDRALHAISEPVSFQGHTLALSISVGLTIYPFDDHTPNVLLSHADQAMYEAKRAGGHCYRCFTPAAAPEPTRTQRLQDIEQALVRDLWQPGYQPIVDGHGHMSGLEIQLRWCRPNGVVVRDETIAGIAEHDLRGRFLERLMALTQRDFADRGPPPAPLHVNLHAADLYDPRLPARLAKWRNTLYHNDPIPVVLELPDAALAAHAPAAGRLAATLGDRGFRLLVDHFPGHGPGALSHISATPVRGVKCRPPADPADARLLKALTAGIKALGLTLYVCDVDDASRREAASRLGFCYWQGLAFAPELDAPSLTRWLKTRAHAP